MRKGIHLIVRFWAGCESRRIAKRALICLHCYCETLFIRLCNGNLWQMSSATWSHYRRHVWLAGYAAPRLILTDRAENHDAYDNDNDCSTAKDGARSKLMPAPLDQLWVLRVADADDNCLGGASSQARNAGKHVWHCRWAGAIDTYKQRCGWGWGWGWGCGGCGGRGEVTDQTRHGCFFWLSPPARYCCCCCYFVAAAARLSAPSAPSAPTVSQWQLYKKYKFAK